MPNPKAARPDRAGEYSQQSGGYKVFIPKPLPPNPPIIMDEELIHLLSLADRAVGRLDAATDNLPDPDFFVYSYVLREATLSSQIEGTQATLDIVLEAQAETAKAPKYPDVDEVFNYADAMNYGLDRLRKDTFPLSLRLIREIHAKLLQGVRGQSRNPGQFRKNQNFIGPKGCTLETATFVPPPAEQMHDALNALEKFIHQHSRLPPLVKVSLLHAQFETIHPFLDGNGRIGRLLITLFLCQQSILRQPLLYLSHYFNRNRLLYYNYLQAIRDTGDWESWVKFFLNGVFSVAQEASETARKIISMRETHRHLIQKRLGQRSGTALRLLDKLYSVPFVSVKKAAKILNVTITTANNLLAGFVEMGILTVPQSKKRNRIFRYQCYYNLFSGQQAPK